MNDSQLATWRLAFASGDPPDLKPWEKLALLEFVCAGEDDDAELAHELLDVPIPVWRLDELVELAAGQANELVACALLEAGAATLPLTQACDHGLTLVIAACLERGARINRRYLNALAPIHRAARSPNAYHACRVLVDAACDLTVLDPNGAPAWEFAEQETRHYLKSAVGERGPRWFRDAQRDGVDHYLLYDDEVMFGFNPNDVQTPIWTGDEVEGFGWPNTPEQAVEFLTEHRRVREELEWFLPFLDRLVAGEEFGLDDLGPRVPKRRPHHGDRR